MAIQKDKILPCGVTGNYWKITDISVNKMTNVVTYIIALFLDLAHGHPDGSTSLGLTKQYTFQSTRSDLQGNLTSMGYTLIQAKANSLVPVIGDPDADPVAFDSDLAGGTPV